MIRNGSPFAMSGVWARRGVALLLLSCLALGGALLFPVIGDGLAGLSLATFAGSLLGLYLRTPGMRTEGGIRPTQQGTPIAKDVWLLGIGLSLMADSARPSRRRSRKERRPVVLSED